MSGKWIVSFCKVASVHYLGEVDIFFSRVFVTFLPAYSNAKIIKIERVFPEL